METGDSRKFREYQAQYEREQKELQKLMTKNSNFSLHDDGEHEQQKQQVKVKQFMPGQSMGLGMKKSQVRFAHDENEIGSANVAED